MISIDFASGNYRLLDRLQKVLFAMLVLLSLATGGIVWNAVSLRGDLAVLSKTVTDLEAVYEKSRPLLEERDRVVRDLNAMSDLTESRRFSWTRLFTSVEEIFPVGVALSKVEYNPRDRGLMLDGNARSPESLTNLMVALEKAPSFSEPYLKHQTVNNGSISFNVMGFYQGYQAAAGAGEK